MAALSIQLAPTNATDAEFRAWCQAISNQLATGGWVKTADTGQINLTTVVKPAATNTSQGYEIWRSNDGGSGLTEFYLKIEYGSGAISANNCAVWITLGWTTNGAGTLTGVISTQTQVGNLLFSSNSSSLFWSNLSTAPGRIQIFMFTGDALFSTSAKGWGFSIERLRNASFEQTNEILILIFRPGGNNLQSIFVQVLTASLAFPQVDCVTTSSQVPLLQANIKQADAVQGGEAGICLQFGQKGGLTAPSSNVFGSTLAALGVAQTNDVKITTYGTERNYIINAGSPFFNSSGVLLITRFE